MKQDHHEIVQNLNSELDKKEIEINKLRKENDELLEQHKTN